MKIRNIVRYFVLLLGICLCAYPLIAGLVEREYQSDAVSTYQVEVEKQEDDVLEQMFYDAEEYNNMLYQSKGSIVSNFRDGILSTENYNKLLNISGTGMMGTINIPKINVNLPIYHGTEEDVLQVGVGHLEGSSLPIGGVNTRSVLTGHRGLPNSKLFTRLDEMEIGDLFYIEIGGETFAYIVNDIVTIRPEDIDSLSIKPEKDLVSLVTCTPYGQNTHRLIVTGERTTYEEAERLNIDTQMASPRELFFTVLPFLMLAILIIQIIKDRKGSKREDFKKKQ